MLPMFVDMKLFKYLDLEKEKEKKKERKRFTIIIPEKVGRNRYRELNRKGDT